MKRAIYFHPPVFSVDLYHCPLPSLEVSSINFISNESIAVKYLGVGTGCTAENAVATEVVMALAREARNAVSTALGIVVSVVLSLSPMFVAATFSEFLFARPAIVQPS